MNNKRQGNYAYRSLVFYTLPDLTLTQLVARTISNLMSSDGSSLSLRFILPAQQGDRPRQRRQRTRAHAKSQSQCRGMSVLLPHVEI